MVNWTSLDGLRWAFQDFTDFDNTLLVTSIWDDDFPKGGQDFDVRSIRSAQFDVIETFTCDFDALTCDRMYKFVCFQIMLFFFVSEHF